MEDYHDLYLKRGALMQVDVFEKVRNKCFKNYGLFEPTSLKLRCNA